MANLPNALSLEQKELIVQSVMNGRFVDILLQSETEDDPYRTVVLHALEPTPKGTTDRFTVLAKYRLNPDIAFSTYKRITRACRSLWREAKTVASIASLCEYSVHYKGRKAA